MKKIHDLASTLGDNLQSITLLLLRLAWGFQLYESGVGHLTHIEKTTRFFAGLQFFGRFPMPFPAANVYLSGSVELAGGILLMLGLFSRPIAVLLLCNFCVAYATASWSEVVAVLHFKSPDDFINDAAFPFLVASLVVLAFGPGRLALDALIFRKSTSGNRAAA
jgi:putative oxidoreductase